MNTRKYDSSKFVELLKNATMQDLIPAMKINSNTVWINKIALDALGVPPEADKMMFIILYNKENEMVKFVKTDDAERGYTFYRPDHKGPNMFLNNHPAAFKIARVTRGVYEGNADFPGIFELTKKAPVSRVAHNATSKLLTNLEKEDTPNE